MTTRINIITGNGEVLAEDVLLSREYEGYGLSVGDTFTVPEIPDKVLQVRYRWIDYHKYEEGKRPSITIQVAEVELEPNAETADTDRPEKKPWQDYTFGELAKFLKDENVTFVLKLGDLPDEKSDGNYLLTDNIEVSDEPAEDMLKALAEDIHSAETFTMDEPMGEGA